MAPAPSILSHPTLAYQPFSTIYKLYRLATILLRFPLWLVKALIPSLRPLPTWTFKQTLARNIAYNMVHTDATLSITKPLSLAPGKEGPRWTTIHPPSDEQQQQQQQQLYTGPMASTTIHPAVIGGTWYSTKTTAAAPTGPDSVPKTWTKIALHFHGGAFVLGDGRQDATGFLGNLLTRHAGFDAVFAPQYRLAGYGGRDPFPAALQDCLTAYLYLVRTLGVAPARITVSGDSAGGNLAVGLLRYLERYGEGGGAGSLLPLPGAVVLLSPWVNPSAAELTDYEGWGLMRTDYLPRAFLVWGYRAYIRQAASAEGISEWVDPLGHPFVTQVPVFVSWAGGEVLGVDCARWAAEMREKRGGAGGDGGWRFEVNVEEGGAPHDTLLAGDVLGWEKSAEEVARKIRRFCGGETLVR
ncbi:alpha/beta-hydrolase [Cryphonectria parasitica EP155]|uniref:Alpha/beta-hydrolase n=1 Tax=Cryphonectria parasitica (strain ATCC 38755 / EP155) TaxID=660469 RepID=A0A9P4XW17_CRYP1|nr:alpha/beta-hydrolase [Cryphonectria parasitica EP155]KAF3761815.1 alpha/beta-hydrolase [Cryphonectria parasitica EP155]